MFPLGFPIEWKLAWKIECPKCGIRYPIICRECPKCGELNPLLNDQLKKLSKTFKKYERLLEQGQEVI